ncbi:MAG TPA: SMP-30/gluconolactonase/LRE family protein [Thermoanaerobaculia bacterium]
MRCLASLLAASLISAALAAQVSPPMPDPAPKPDPLQETINRLGQLAAAEPQNGAILYALAAFHDRAGQPEKAIERLRELMRIGWDYALYHGDFPNSRERPEYREIAARLEAAMLKVQKAKPEFTVRERDLLPEGAAYDPETGSLFLSSIHKRKVVRIDRHGITRNFTGEAQDGLLGGLGMRVDAKRRMLWVVSVAQRSMKGFTPAGDGRSAVHAFHLGSGSLATCYTLGGPEDPSFLNDVAVLDDGRAFITDTQRGAVYVAEPGRTELVSFLPPGSLIAPNGIDVSRDQKRLYVAGFRGIFVVDLATKALAPLSVPQGMGNFSGIDGLYFHEGSLVGIQNAVGQPRIWRIYLSPSQDAAVRAEVLESGTPGFDLPTTGAVAGDSLLFVANTQIRMLDKNEKPLPPERFQDLKVLRLPL